MSILSINLLLAVAWAALWGELSLVALGSGFLVGFGALAPVQPRVGSCR